MVKTQLSMFDNVEDQAANVQEQVLNASVTGGVTEQADDPTQDRLQIANILTPILKAASEMSGAATKVSEDTKKSIKNFAELNDKTMGEVIDDLVNMNKHMFDGIPDNPKEKMKELKSSFKLKS